MGLIREIHGVLLSKGRGSHQAPGEFRRTQNWIGGTRPGNAAFVPPPAGQVPECMGKLELFLHDQPEPSPALLKAALAHVQFETIHPFLDGNGRLGRLLVPLLLVHAGLLEEPVLYLSLYLKKHRQQYYQLLQEVREQGAWETWIEFFLDGVFSTSDQAVVMIKEMRGLFEADSHRVLSEGRLRLSCEKILHYMRRLPQVSVLLLTEQLALSPPTVRQAINHLVDLRILEEVTGRQRDRVYVYRRYLDVLEEGADPF